MVTDKLDLIFFVVTEKFSFGQYNPKVNGNSNYNDTLSSLKWYTYNMQNNAHCLKTAPCHDKPVFRSLWRYI